MSARAVSAHVVGSRLTVRVWPPRANLSRSPLLSVRKPEGTPRGEGLRAGRSFVLSGSLGRATSL